MYDKNFFDPTISHQAGKGDKTASHTDFRAYQKGWEPLEKAIADKKKKRKKK